MAQNVDKPAVTAVIVTYHSRETVGAALDALHEAHQTGLAEAVVVDNASTDGTADFVAENYPWVTLVRSAENVGFGRGCNLGFERVQTPFVLFLNPDAVFDTRAITTLVKFMEAHPRAGIVAPAIIENGQSIQKAGMMTTPGSLVQAALGSTRPYADQRLIVPAAAPFQTSWVCGAVMLVRSTVFRELAGFDPRFFLYFEETDLCRRATAAGIEIWAAGEAVATHIGGASAHGTGESMTSSCIAEHYYRSRFHYLVKHFGWIRSIAVEGLLRVIGLAKRVRNSLRRQETVGNTARDKRHSLQIPAQPREAS